MLGVGLAARERGVWGQVEENLDGEDAAEAMKVLMML